MMLLIGLAVVLGVGIALSPVGINAQPADKLYRIGMLERTPAPINAANLEGFRQGLRALGYVEGKKSGLMIYSLMFTEPLSMSKRVPTLG